MLDIGITLEYNLFMSKLYYTQAKFKFSKRIQMSEQYFLNKWEDTEAVFDFLRRFEGKSAIYAFETHEGTKVGITENLKRRFKELLKPWVSIKRIFFITFSPAIGLSFLEPIEKLIKNQHINHTKRNSSEFFTGKQCYEIANRIKYHFHNRTRKYDRVSSSKVKFNKKVYDRNNITHSSVKSQNYKELGDMVYSFYKEKC